MAISHSSKRAQLSLLIVIGLVATLVIGVFGIVAFDIGPLGTTSAKGAKQFIQMCFTTTAECALHRLGANSGSLGFTEQIPDIADAKENGASYFSNALASCFDDFKQLKNQGQDVLGEMKTPDVVLIEQPVRIAAENNLAVKEGVMTTDVGDYQEKFDIPFADMYREALKIKHDAKPDGVPDEYLKLDSDFDVSVASKNSKKFISIAGGELRKQYFRFNVVK